MTTMTTTTIPFVTRFSIVEWLHTQPESFRAERGNPAKGLLALYWEAQGIPGACVLQDEVKVFAPKEDDLDDDGDPSFFVLASRPSTPDEQRIDFKFEQMRWAPRTVSRAYLLVEFAEWSADDKVAATW